MIEHAHILFLPGRIPRTEEPGGLLHVVAKSQTRVSDSTTTTISHTHITESLCATPKIKIKSTILQLRKKKQIDRIEIHGFRSPGPRSSCNYSLVYGFLGALVPYPALSTFQLCFVDPTPYCLKCPKFG